MLETVISLLRELENDKPHMPPTMLYNEGWLLRVILHWFSQNRVAGHPFSFMPQAEWYSEGLLPSKFLPAYQGDKLGESYTHADGVIGHIAVGDKGRGGVFLTDPFKQLIVLEAKLFSKPSGGTTNAPGYNQVARNIACMASVTERSGCSIDGFSSLGFYLLAPASQIKKVISFTQFMEKDLVYKKVHARVESYRERHDYEEKRRWFKEYFEPLLSKADLQTISWEIIIESIKRHDNEAGEKLARFYDLCLEFNSSK